MTGRRRGAVAVAAVVVALLVPAAASAHAYLIKTAPAASVILSKAPGSVQLTYDEAVEPRFAIVSVTNVNASSETTGPVVSWCAWTSVTETIANRGSTASS